MNYVVSRGLTYLLNSIDQLHYAVTRITTHHYNDDRNINPTTIKTATGFFYHNFENNLLFLVTNRHVVVDEGKNYHPNAIILRLHTNQNDLRQNIEYNIHLHRGIRSIWRNPNSIAADVVAIKIDIDDFNRQGIICKSFASNNLLPNDIQLNVAEDVFVMGYPLGIYDEVHNLPLTRGGTISSPYPIPWNGNPYFLIDANLEEGTSGSPVITKFKASWRLRDGSKFHSGLAMFLLGINSSTFPEREVQKSPLGLNAVYFARIIDQMTRIRSA
jgi:Trypsin-like peptidase domain